MNHIPYRLVTFDATNTLLRLSVSPGIKYAEVANMYGIKCNKKALGASFKSNYIKQMKAHPNYGYRTGIGWESWWKQVAKNTFRDANCSASDEKLDIVVTQLVDLYKTESCWRPKEGAFGILSYLRHRRIPVGVISNFDPRLHDILRNIKMRHYLKFVLTSFEAGVEKPDNRIFKEAMGRSGIVSLKPEECLHIGDCIMADYYAAINNKWKGMLVKKDRIKFKGEHPSINPKDVFGSLFDVLKYMVKENRPRVLYRGPRYEEAKPS